MASDVTSTIRRRQIPWRYLSKRMKRRLLRYKGNRFLLWLRCRRPKVYARLTSYRSVRFWSLITNISPWDTPFVTMAPRVSAQQLLHTWVTDELRPMEGPDEA